MRVTFSTCANIAGVRLSVSAQGRIIDSKQCLDQYDAALYVLNNYQHDGVGIVIPSEANTALNVITEVSIAPTTCSKMLSLPS